MIHCFLPSLLKYHHSRYTRNRVTLPRFSLPVVIWKFGFPTTLITCFAAIGICQQLPMDSHSLKLPSHKPDTNITPAAYRLALVQRIFELGNPSANAIQLHRMGDEAGLDLVKILGTTSLSTAQVNTALQIVHLAFEKTSQLVDQANLQPTATLV